MATQALYNKWRGQTFDDILGQEHITQTLKNQIKAGRVGHAYLFTGLRGTGKTSTARILAKAVNCVGETDEPPCNRCHICRSITAGRSLDLIEIDAASNRGIDEIRDLRDGVAFAPHEARYKVHVIDEVHMLTNEAFNALLKTLEEPPQHIIFILCTTEPHRLPDTILSRCQRFDFRRGSVSAVLQKLQQICTAEEIAITPEAMEMIARRGGGSFRDAESLLDQLASYGSTEITPQLVQSVLGSVPTALVAQLVESLVAGDVSAGLYVINQAIDNGAEPRQFLSEILDHLRALLLIRMGSAEHIYYLSDDALDEMRRMVQEHSVAPALIVQAIRLFNDAGQGLRDALRPQLPLELAFIEAILQDGQAPPIPYVAPRRKAEATTAAPPTPRAAPLTERPEAPVPSEPEVASTADEATPRAPTAPAAEPQVEKPEPEQPIATSTQEPEAKEVPPSEPPQVAEESPVAYAGDEDEEDEPQRTPSLEWVQGNWNLILSKIKPRDPKVQALLNSAYPVAVKGDKVTLACEHKFHRDMLSDEKRLPVVEEAVSDVLGAPFRVECTFDSDGYRAGQGTESSLSENRDLFSPPSREVKDTSREEQRQELLNHPAVKRLTERGAKVTSVRLHNENER